jgi:hypothetical protein
MQRDKAKMISSIVRQLILSTAFLERVEPFLDPRFLIEPHYIKICRYCFRYYKDHNEAPGAKNIWNYYDKESDQLSNDEREQIKEILEYLKLDQPRDCDLEDAVNLTEEWCEKQKQEQIEAIENDDDIRDISLEDYLAAHEAINTLKRKGFTAYELSKMNLPEIEWIIEGLIKEGLTIFAGKPKVGKSYFMLNACIDLASGSDVFGAIPTEPKEVLYLSLEGRDRLLKEEQAKILEGREAPQKLHIQFEWPKHVPDKRPRYSRKFGYYQQEDDDKAIEALEKWMTIHPDTRLIIIDTLIAFKGSRGISYDKDHEYISEFQKFAGKHHIAVVLIHHCRKSTTKDTFEGIMGSTGLQGAADTMVTLTKTGNEQDRLFTYGGRGISEGELTFKYDGYQYTLTEEPYVIEEKMSKERQKIIDYLEFYDKEEGKPITRKKLVEEMTKQGLGKGVDVLFEKMVAKGDIEKVEYGLYARKGFTHEKELEEVFLKMRARSLARSRERRKK